MDILDINLIYIIGGALGVSIVSFAFFKKKKKKEKTNNKQETPMIQENFFNFQEDIPEKEPKEKLEQNENPIIEAKVFLTFGLKEQAIFVLQEGLKENSKKNYHKNIETVLNLIKENENSFNMQNWQNSWEKIEELENPLEKAELLYINGKYSDAIEILEQELLKNPDNIFEIRKKLIKIGEKIVLL